MKTQTFSVSRGLSFSLLATLTACFLVTAPTASGVVTAFFIDNGTANGTTNIGAGISPNNRHSGQSFLATVSGTLQNIRLALVLSTGLGGEDVDVEIFSTSGGLPTTLLGSVTIAEASIPADVTTGYSVTADFSAGSAINLAAGTTYAIMTSTPTSTNMTGPAAHRYFLRGEGTTQATYTDGNLLFSTDDGATYSGVGFDFDINFEVNVIPEPSRVLLLSGGLYAVLAVRRRRFFSA